MGVGLDLCDRSFNDYGDNVRSEYFFWLYSKAKGGNDVKFIVLATELHRMEFYCVMPEDNNRAEDGLILRNNFAEEMNDYFPDAMLYLDEIGACTVFEMLIALAKRASFMLTGMLEGDDIWYETVEGWFWEFMDNLELSNLTDKHFLDQKSVPIIHKNVEKMMDRRYSKTGKGSLFPLHFVTKKCNIFEKSVTNVTKSVTNCDFRHVELWLQMNQYIQKKFNL